MDLPAHHFSVAHACAQQLLVKQGNQVHLVLIGSSHLQFKSFSQHRQYCQQSAVGWGYQRFLHFKIMTCLILMSC